MIQHCSYKLIEVSGELYFSRCERCNHERWEKYPPDMLHRICPGEQQNHTKSRIHGIGDVVEKMLTNVGITKERITKWLGRPCNCKKRQDKLNKLGWWAMDAITGKSDKPADELRQLLKE